LTFDYQIGDDHMVYLTSSEAFRAGGYSYSVSAATSGAAQTQAIEQGFVAAFTPPEQVRSDEIGFRTEWLDGRLRLNLTYFDMAYTNRQGPVQVADPTSPTGIRIQLVNTGDVDLSGYELEGQIAATENFLIDFSAGLVDSTMKDPCANNGDFLFPGPVEDSYSLGGRWSLPLSSGGGLTFALSYAYTARNRLIQAGRRSRALNPNGTPNASQIRGSSIRATSCRTIAS
jgi:iron complex outermembrane receptor protein